MKNNKLVEYSVIAIFSLVIATFTVVGVKSIFAVSPSQNLSAAALISIQEVKCPLGYVCAPITYIPNCPVNYICTPVGTTTPPIPVPTPNPIPTPIPAPAPVPINPPITSTSTCYFFATNLNVGSTGADVKALQELFTTQSFLPIKGAGIDPVGYYGPATQAAVKAYQTKVGLPATGAVGPETRIKLNQCLVTGPVSSVSVSAPKSGEILQQGQKYIISWTGQNISTSDSFTVSIFNGPSANYNYPNTTIVGGLLSIYSYSWTVQPNNGGWGVGMNQSQNFIAKYLGIKNVEAASNQYVIQVCKFNSSGVNSNVCGTSGVFTINTPVATSSPVISNTSTTYGSLISPPNGVGTTTQQFSFLATITTGSYPIFISKTNSVGGKSPTAFAVSVITSANMGIWPVSLSTNDGLSSADGSTYFYIAPGQSRTFTANYTAVGSPSSMATVQINGINYGTSTSNLSAGMLTDSALTNLKAILFH